MCEKGKTQSGSFVAVSVAVSVGAAGSVGVVVVVGAVQVSEATAVGCTGCGFPPKLAITLSRVI